MNGHAVTGGVIGISCEKSCIIAGPGTITGAIVGIAGHRRATATVSDVNISGCGFAGILDGTAHLTVHATNVTVTGSQGPGIQVRNLLATNVSANNNGTDGLYAYVELRGTNLTANNNGGTGVVVFGRTRVANVTANNNTGGGVTAYKSARLDGLTAQGNTGPGIFGERPRLRNSTVTGNVFHAAPLDLLTERRPRLLNTSCDHSARFDEEQQSAGAPWGVCSGD